MYRFDELINKCIVPNQWEQPELSFQLILDETRSDPNNPENTSFFIELFAAISQDDRIVRLNLWRCNLTDRFLEVIAPYIWQSSSIQRLLLCENRLTDESIPTIRRIIKYSWSIEYIRIVGNQITRTQDLVDYVCQHKHHSPLRAIVFEASEEEGEGGWQNEGFSGPLNRESYPYQRAFPSCTLEQLNGCFNICHVSNLVNICRSGILSHRKVQRRNIEHRDISNSEVQDRREERRVWRAEVDKYTNLHKFAVAYLNPHNAMLNVRGKRDGYCHLCVLYLDRALLYRRDAVITDRNAALGIGSCTTSPRFFRARDFRLNVERVKATFGPSSYPDYQYPNFYHGHREITCFDHLKEARQAEVLIPNRIDPGYIRAVFVCSEGIAQNVRQLLEENGIHLPVLVYPSMFFNVGRRNVDLTNISEIPGIQKVQTLTEPEALELNDQVASSDPDSDPELFRDQADLASDIDQLSESDPENEYGRGM